MSWYKAMKSKELSEGDVTVVTLNDQKVLLARYQGQAYATASDCPHMGANLGRGKISEDGAIVCPLHHSAFDLATGNVKEWSPWPPVVGKVLGAVKHENALQTYPVREADGVISVEL